MPQPSLTVIDGAEAGLTSVIGEVAAIGRQADNQLVLTATAVSRRHARIIRRGEAFFLEDLGSAHGTTVNEEKIKSRELKDGDIIGIGPVRLRFTGATPSAHQPTATSVLWVEPTGTRAKSASFTCGSPLTLADKAARFETLLEVGLSFQTGQEVARILPHIAQSLLCLFDVDRVGIFLQDRSAPVVALTRDRVDPATLPPFSRTLLARAFDAGEALVTADAGRDARIAGASLAGGTLCSAMVAPLRGRERIVGAVVVENRGRTGAFINDDLKYLIFLANFAGTAVENAHLVGEICRETEERAALSRFLSPAVSASIRHRGLSQGLHNEKREVTVLFTDIRGFTTLSETLPPEELIAALNRAFTVKIDAIFAEDGTVDKFTGDGIMAFFGAPADQPDHAARALAAAGRILSDCRAITTASGQPLPTGIGIATGVATVGAVGSLKRMEYTALGDVVNIAARLVARAAADEILISETTLRQLPADTVAAPAGEWQLKGKQETIRVFRIAAPPAGATAHG